MVALLGTVGLAVDVGRMYIVKNESQSFVDSIALTATVKLNGDKSGVDAAVSAVQNGMNSHRWDTGLNPFVWANTTVEFSSSSAPGIWTDAAGVAAGTPVAGGPPRPVATDRVRVTTSVSLPMFFIVVATRSPMATIAASATAIRSGITSLPANTNVIPFSAISHKAINTQIDDPNDPFGLLKGQYYTLRWDKKSTTQCQGDGADVVAWAQSSEMDSWLGSVCQDANTCKTEIRGQGMEIDISTGIITIPTKEGVAESIIDAVNDRVDNLVDIGDTDPADTGSQSYFGPDGYQARGIGNGRRVVWSPINTGIVTASGSASQATVAGFGAFLMMNSQFVGNGNGANAICGQYLGSMIPGLPFSGGVSPGANPPVSDPSLAVRLGR